MTSKSKKPKNRLQFEKEVKPQSDLYHRSPVKTGREALQHTVLNKLHSKVAEVENENTGVEAAHQMEQKRRKALHGTASERQNTLTVREKRCTVQKSGTLKGQG